VLKRLIGTRAFYHSVLTLLIPIIVMALEKTGAISRD